MGLNLSKHANLYGHVIGGAPIFGGRRFGCVTGPVYRVKINTESFVVRVRPFSSSQGRPPGGPKKVQKGSLLDIPQDDQKEIKKDLPWKSPGRTKTGSKWFSPGHPPGGPKRDQNGSPLDVPREDQNGIKIGLP